MKIYTKNLFIKKSILCFLFRLGLSSVFLVNSLTAWFSPTEFIDLLKSNSLVSAIASPDFWIPLIGINDGLLFLIILLGRWHKVVAVWAAFWVIAVIYVTGFGVTEFIEHAGLLSLIVYYYFAFKQSYKKQ